MLALLIAIPLFSAILVSLIGLFSRRFFEPLAILTSFLTTMLSLFTMGKFLQQGILVYRLGGWQDIGGIPVAIFLVLDGLSAFLLPLINLIFFCSILFSVRYITEVNQKPKYYTMLLLILNGLNGVVLTGDIFNLFIFLELAAISSYSLLAFKLGKEELEASFKYLIFGRIGSAFILLGIIFLYFSTGTLNMADIARQSIPPAITSKVAVLFLLGFGIEAGLFPLHMWLPDAHQNAPAPISAIFSGILIKILGLYSMIRLFYNVLGVTDTASNLLLIIGNLSMFFAVMVALYQWDFKRLLAYHTISQVGYIVVGLGLNTPLSIFGGLFHLLNHSLFKSLLFLNSGAIEHSTGTRDLRKLGNLRESMPFTYLTNLVGSFSISGIPPFNGFWSKLVIIIAALQAGETLTALNATLVSILTLASFLKVLKYAFWGESGELKNSREVFPSMYTPMFILALLCLLSSLLIFDGLRSSVMVILEETILIGKAWALKILP